MAYAAAILTIGSFVMAVLAFFAHRENVKATAFYDQRAQFFRDHPIPDTENLTEQEAAVLLLVTTIKRNDKIATALHLDEKTVDTIIRKYAASIIASLKSK